MQKLSLNDENQKGARFMGRQEAGKAAKHSGYYCIGSRFMTVHSASTSHWTETTCHHLAGNGDQVLHTMITLK
jgi:hypothetical protein